MKRPVTQMKNSGLAVKTCKTCRRLQENGSCRLSYAYIKDCVEHGLAHWQDKDRGNDE